MFEVSFDGERVPLTEVQENPARFARRLERAKIVPGFAQCHCRTDAPRKLVIRRYGSLFHLAGWPDDGVHHAEGCEFRKTPGAAAGDGSDSTAAIVIDADGLNVRLDASLLQREVASGPRARSHTTSNGTSRRAAPLLAFMQTLWVSAGLNSWTGTNDHRGWGAVNSMLLGGLGENARINGASAQDVLHVMRRYEESERDAINAEFERFLATITTDGKVSRRALVLGEIGAVGETKYGASITLRQRKLRYYASNALIEQTTKKYGHAWRAIAESTARVIGLLLIERTTKGHLIIIDLAAMLCSAAFIPCDSIHEVAMANRLVGLRRVFEKPIRMAEGDQMLPDFVLLDNEPATHIEVYGMNGLASYEERKAKKRAMRLARGIPTVEWDVDRQTVRQARLPSPVQRT
ncbi:DUF1173 family protein [Paraburkholderia sp. CNPSo 3274]|uniref:DUF1173 family protein n=1 Tax=Paraburkholderia sp. CNPSo 3274 TaxID=2940932 RepID=UPI0020B8BE76|nr:DUF1173 family protein [Paraburkholderia sp. CNPSo 3274]MCP3712283.1 DUF1173 family protein [Paraburkholderia sp. CNPSo 3274]